MDQLCQDERVKYNKVWLQPAYRRASHGLKMWTDHRDMFPVQVEGGLDLGCGTGRLFAQWCEEGINGVGVDISEYAPDATILEDWPGRFFHSPLWDFNAGQRFDIGICADVMEHIPEEKVLPVFERIAAHCDQTWFQIAEFGSNYLGYDLHPTRKPADWWRERMLAMGGEVEEISLDTGRQHHVFRWQVR